MLTICHPPHVVDTLLDVFPSHPCVSMSTCHSPYKVNILTTILPYITLYYPIYLSPMTYYVNLSTCHPPHKADTSLYVVPSHRYDSICQCVNLPLPHTLKALLDVCHTHLWYNMLTCRHVTYPVDILTTVPNTSPPQKMSTHWSLFALTLGVWIQTLVNILMLFQYKVHFYPYR